PAGCSARTTSCRTRSPPVSPSASVAAAARPSRRGWAVFERGGDYPFTRMLEENWRDVLAEYRAVAAEMHAWPETQLYNRGWDTFGLYAFGNKRHANCQRCPKTTARVEPIPGLG